jgi:hypothetical protein
MNTFTYFARHAPRAVRTAMLTPPIQKYVDVSNMKIDASQLVARSIVAPIRRAEQGGVAAVCAPKSVQHCG